MEFEAARSTLRDAAANATAIPSTVNWVHDVLEALPTPCALYLRATGVLLHANRAFARAFPVDAKAACLREFGGRLQCFDIAADEHEDDVIELARRRGEAIDVYQASTGQWFSLHVADMDKRGRPPCSLISIVNTTAQREALRTGMSRQEELLFASRTMSVGEMATAMAHELNQPLAAVINYLNVGLKLLDANGHRDPDMDEVLTLARTQAEHASAVISHMREYVQAREPTREEHCVNDIIGNVAQLIRLETQQNRVTLRLDTAGDLPAVRVDRVMIEQVMLNLLKNAIEAMRETPPANRQVTVTSRLGLDGEIEVRVADRGSGVSQADEDNLFSPFFTTKPEGFGVGLAICRSIMEYHEGRLYFERTADGAGTVFAITLPPA